MATGTLARQFDRLARPGDVLTIDGENYTVREWDQPTEQYFVVKAGADAGEFLLANYVEAGLQGRTILFAVRQLRLTGMGDQDGD